MAYHIKYNTTTREILGITITDTDPLVADGFATLDHDGSAIDITKKYVDETPSLQDRVVSNTIPTGAYGIINDAKPILLDGWTPTADGTYTIKFVGKYSGTVTILYTTLPVAQDNQWNTIKAIRDEKLLVQTVTWTDDSGNNLTGSFDTDDTGKSNLLGQAAAIQILGSSAPSSISWRMHDNNLMDFTPQQFLEASVLVMQSISNVYATSWQLEADIYAATDIATVKGITWPTT